MGSEQCRVNPLTVGAVIGTVNVSPNLNRDLNRSLRWERSEVEDSEYFHLPSWYQQTLPVAERRRYEIDSDHQSDENWKYSIEDLLVRSLLLWLWQRGLRPSQSRYVLEVVMVFVVIQEALFEKVR